MRKLFGIAFQAFPFINGKKGNLSLIIRRRQDEYLIFLWLICCPVFIFFLHLETIPRYFLLIIPAQSLLLGLFLDELSKTRVKKILKIDWFYILIFLIIVAKSTLIIKYYNFILNYNF